MKMLDDLFGKFDALCLKLELMKVETIGDALSTPYPLSFFFFFFWVTGEIAAGEGLFAVRRATESQTTVPLRGLRMPRETFVVRGRRPAVEQGLPPSRCRATKDTMQTCRNGHGRLRLSCTCCALSTDREQLWQHGQSTFPSLI